MKTLVIHPKDITTDCLKVIYEKRPEWDVIRNPLTPRKVVEREIESHDRIIMLGHGTPYGLLAAGPSGRFDHYIVDGNMIELLMEKETYSIWCHSDEFFAGWGKGFHTGMIISEVGEEWYCLHKIVLNKEKMAKNMELFCGTCAKYFDLPPEEAREKILEEYVGDDEVTQFNRKNIVVL